MNTVMEIIKNYEGIIGALLGVIVTTILNQYMRSKGKVNFYFSNYKQTLYIYDKGRRRPIEEGFKNIDYFDYEIDVEIYNSADINKIVRDIKLEFVCEDGTIYDTPRDKETRYSTSGALITEDITFSNIKPKEMVKLSFCGYISESKGDINNLLRIKKIYFIAKDSNNKTIKKLMKEFK